MCNKDSYVFKLNLLLFCLTSIIIIIRIKLYLF